jgi:uncharacterized membrane protein YtjA (UPF0391 family)
VRRFTTGAQLAKLPYKAGGKLFGATIALDMAEAHTIMLHWTLVFLVIALIAGVLGFVGIAGTAAEIAKILFFVFLVLWLISFVSRRRI